MSAFGSYARLYDAFYADKDYAAEAAYLDGLLRDFGAGRRVLDLGCGTGRHLEQLARLGYGGVGVELSPAMLEAAAERLRPFGALRLSQGDARSVRLDERFETVLACFHVMNYLAEPGDFARGLATAREHLDPGGVLVFDSWHGPAVRREPPERRVKLARTDTGVATRRAEPRHWPERQRVDVVYRFEVPGADAVEEYEETHRLRYLFPEEVDRELGRQGFRRLDSFAWNTRRAPTEADWSVCYIARAS